MPFVVSQRILLTIHVILFLLLSFLSIFQCAKLLANTDVIQFYPSKFVLITEILDTFGKLVFERIWEKSTYKPKGSSVAMQLPGKVWL